MNLKTLLGSILLLLISFTACKKDNVEDSVATSPVEFDFAASSNALKSTDLSDVTSALVSIVNSDSTIIYDLEEIDLISFNDSYISDQLLLEVGDYQVTEFLILDSNGNVIYASPKEGSDLALLVDNPLSVDFTVEKNETTTVPLEVLSIESYNPSDFGYVEFGFSYVKTFNFVVGIYTLDSEENSTASNANITVTANSKTLIDKEIEGALNILTVNDGLEEYELEITKDGYETYTQSYALEELKQYENTPLDIYLESIDSVIIDYSKITDASITSYYPDNNYGDQNYLQSYTWTINGTSVTCRTVMAFDLSEIPQGTTIKNATLSLYYADNLTNNIQGFSGGENDLKIELIAESWDADTITWNNQPSVSTTNAVTIPADGNGKIDKPDIDITELIQTMINNSDGNFGVMISQVDETPYRSSFFASTENEVQDKRPILKIEF